MRKLSSGHPLRVPLTRLRRRGSISALGRDYLQRHPAEADKRLLLSRIPGTRSSTPLITQLPRLQPLFVSDYESGNVVGVDGWVLAVSEARAAAAISLGA